MSPDGQRQSRLPHRTILVVDDDPGVRRVATRILVAQTYQVLEAEDGARAVEILAEKPEQVDLVLTDVVMPVMNGRELADAIAQRWPHVQLLFMSGYAGDEIVGRGLLDPGTPFLRKPFTPALLAIAIRSVLAA
ncbi:MAG TPA: response regulator [Gemmatimonadales bacterium]|nr:response regulator [Gemmatimonadales bacterium]